MSLDALVTRLEITPRGELYVGIRNLNGIFFPWKNLFVTKILGRSSSDHESFLEASFNFERLRDQIRNNPALCNFRDRLKRDYFWIYQLFAPVNVKNDLPEEFVRGNYTSEARWRLANPGTIVTLEDNIVEALKTKEILDDKIHELKSSIGESRKKSYATRTFNDMNKLFDGYSGNFESLLERAKEITTLKKLDVKILEQMRDIAEFIGETNNKLENVWIRYAHDSKGRREHLPRVEMQDYGFLKKWRKMSAEEFFGLKWMFIDIEIPNFRKENPEITWIGMKHHHADGVISEIYTVHELDRDDVCGFKILQAESPLMLRERLEKRINELDPDIVVTYSNFDLVELKESEAGFPIGENKTNPLFRVTTPFFERIGIKDRLVVDFMRWQRIARAYDINAKLEMTVGFNKEIGYREMEMLENGSTDDRTRIAEYLANDVDRLFSIFSLDEFRRDAEDVLWMSAEMCDGTSVSVERLLHNPNSINDLQEKSYFIKNGIFRSEVPPYFKTQKNQQKEENAREIFAQFINEQINEGEIEGLVENAHKVYIPIGDFFRRILSSQSEDIERFFEYKDRFRNDKKRLFFLEQYSRSLARWMITDLGNFLKARFELEEVASPFVPLPNGFFRVKKFIDPKDFDEYFEQKGKLTRHRIRFAANYKTSIDNTLNELRERADQINEFLKTNGLEIVARNGYYLYLLGERDTLERTDAPIVIVDEIPGLYNADKPYYRKHGFISHMRIEEDPSYHLCLFEMDVFGEILNYLLEGNSCQARDRFEVALDEIEREKISAQDLIFKNESKERYFAFTKPKHETRATHFVLEERFLHEPVCMDQENGLRYYNDVERGRAIKVYHLDIDSLNFDKIKYKGRIFERGRRMLAPVMEKQLEIF